MFRFYENFGEYILSVSLIRHAYRRATFPRGEGFRAINSNLSLCITFLYTLYLYGMKIARKNKREKSQGIVFF